MTTVRSKVILFFDHTAKMAGGEIALYDLVTRLDSTRYTPVVYLASDGTLAARLRASHIETHIFPLPPSVVEARKENLSLFSLFQIRQARECWRYARRLAKFARERGVDLIHCNSLKADVIGGMAGYWAGIPTVWHIRDHINDQYLPPHVARLFRRLARHIPTGIIANSRSTLSELRLDESASKLYQGIAYSGIPLEDFDVAAASSGLIKDGPIQVVMIGRITPWKGQDVFLRAAAKVAASWPQARFQIVGTSLFGEQDYARKLRAMVEELGLQEQVEFLGFREDIPALLAKATMVIHASTIGEPFGRVVVEGMAASRPVIATDGGATREIVVAGTLDGPPTEGETGFLVPMKDAETMARAIDALLSDRDRALAMGEAGRRRVAERFTIASTVRSIETIYEHLLGLPEGAASPPVEKKTSQTQIA